MSLFADAPTERLAGSSSAAPYWFTMILGLKLNLERLAVLFAFYLFIISWPEDLDLD